MPDPKNYLYISDLDGTLLTPGGGFPDAAAARLNRLIDRGLMFSIATARNYDAAYPLLQALNLNLPVVLFNGVYLTEFHSGRNIRLSRFIPRHIVADLIDLAGSMGVDPFIFNQANRVYFRGVTNPGSQNYVREQGGNGRLQRVSHYDFLKSEDISGSLFIDSRAVLEPLYLALKEKYPADLNLYFAEDIAVRGHYWLQVFHRSANKGRMVEQLAEHAQIPLAKTVVFGDYLNDLEMFKIAGRAIAVENALPEVKRAAHQVIGGNDTFGVIDYLESLMPEETAPPNSAK
ncbi:MAG: HAD family hydrolase [Nitrospinales bacterium]